MCFINNSKSNANKKKLIISNKNSCYVVCGDSEERSTGNIFNGGFYIA